MRLWPSDGEWWAEVARNLRESAKNHPGLLGSPTEIEAVPVAMKEINRLQQWVPGFHPGVACLASDSFSAS
jgi:hypothetical protein